MNDNNDAILLKLLFILGLLYAFYRIVETIAEAFGRLLDGLVTLALIGAAIVALRWLHHYLTDKQYDQNKRMKQAHALEQQKKAYLAQAPKHLKTDIEAYFNKKQTDLFAVKPTSRFEDFLDTAKQVLSTFRRKEK